jgi:sigma-B regulation protein RsbU (phosphoserine phosphatase)
MLVIYSDGVIDARDMNGVPFGIEALVQELKANLGHPAREVQDEMIGKLSEFVGDAQSFDDITLITITRTNGS